MVAGQSLLMEEIRGLENESCGIDVLLHSSGIWSLSDAKGFLTYALPRLLLQLCLIFILTQCLHAALKRLYLPRLVSEIMTGVILGPTILGRVSPTMLNALFPEEGEVFMLGLSVIGFIFFMFLVGVKMDPSKVFKSGLRAWIIGIVGVVVPNLVFLGGMPLDYLPGYQHPAVRSVIGTLTMTPFPVISLLLMDLKITNTELGRLALAATLICDLLSTAAGTVISNVRMALAGWSTALAVKPYALSLLVIVVMLSTRPFFRWIVQQTPEGKHVKRHYISLVAFMVILAAVAGRAIGLTYHISPFLFGLCVPDGPPLGSTLVQKLETVITGICMPLLLTFCGMKIDLVAVYDLGFMRLLCSLVTLSVVVRFLSTLFSALLCKMPTRDAAALSAIMSTQGNVHIALYFNMFTHQHMDSQSFTVMISSVMIISSVSWILVKFFYDYSKTYTGYQKRTILHASPNAELRILACAHRPDDAVASLNLLANSNPTKESPVVVYALHLMELAGRASPLMVNHQLGQKSSGSGSRSENIIKILVQLQKHYQDLMIVHAFTSISLIKFMHLDICSLAFDKSVSMIILPFHRKWNHFGKLAFDNNALRMVNQQVLEMAPCSVGILIDRSKIRAQQSTSPSNSPYNVAVIFLGGNDDREALAYAKRMSRSMTSIQLTVFRLVALEDVGSNQWDTILDIEVLKDLRLMCMNQRNLDYKEEKVRDGPETALIVNELKEEYDLIIVGRHHQKDSPLLTGLTEWSELQELGPIVDILASEEIKRPVSVLVVQQQLVKK